MPYTWLSDKNFTKYVGDRPRNYHALIMFTATGASYQCAICVAAKATFVTAAELYSEQYDFLAGNTDVNTNANARDADASALHEASTRVAFFVLEVDNARGTFTSMGLETVPRIYALPPTQSTSPKLRMSDFEVSVQSVLEGPKGFLDEVKRITGVRVAVTISPWPILLLLGVAGYFLALLAAAAVHAGPKVAMLWYRSPLIWASVSTLCFCVGVSGTIFCIIRSAPLYGRPYGGKPLEIFATQGQQQFVLEGVVVALLTICCGVALTIIAGAPKWPIGSFLRHVMVIVGMTVFIVCGLELMDAYVFKTPWYTTKETLPKAVWIYIASGVKKTSSLPKRLLRLSEIWLYEFKDWASFGKKSQSLLGDWASQMFGLTP